MSDKTLLRAANLLSWVAIGMLVLAYFSFTNALKDATVVETHADIEAIVVGELERVYSKTSAVDIMHDDGRLMGV